MDLITRTILGYTAEVVGVNPDHIATPCRKRELIIARAIFADIAYTKYRYTYAQIGRILHRDHSSVTHAVRTLANDCEQRPELKHLHRQVFNKTADFLQRLEG